jgi:hypothetical protein
VHATGEDADLLARWKSGEALADEERPHARPAHAERSNGEEAAAEGREAGAGRRRRRRGGRRRRRRAGGDAAAAGHKAP